MSDSHLKLAIDVSSILAPQESNLIRRFVLVQLHLSLRRRRKPKQHVFKSWLLRPLLRFLSPLLLDIPLILFCPDFILCIRLVNVVTRNIVEKKLPYAFLFAECVSWR